MENCKTILIVEDDLEIRVVLKEVLQNEGYNVLTAGNGFDALEILAQAQYPALIFLDIMMPIMDGHQFLKILKQNVALSPIPVVVTSAHANLKEVVGADSFIRKPLDLFAVLRVAREYCGSPK